MLLLTKTSHQFKHTCIYKERERERERERGEREREREREREKGSNHKFCNLVQALP